MTNQLRTPRFPASVGGNRNLPIAVSASAAVRILPANRNRSSVLLQNFTGTQICYLGSDSTVTTSVYNAFLTGTVGANITLYTRKEVWGISAVAAQTLAIWEEELVDG